MIEILKKFRYIKWKYLFYGSVVYVGEKSTIQIGKGVKIKKSKIHLDNCSHMIIGDDVQITNTLFAINKGMVNIGSNSYFSNGEMPTKQRIIINEGEIHYGRFNRIRSEFTWVRFGGKFILGDYVNINEYSEIRCDESINIGKFVGISYHVIIWDTNTHEFENKYMRRNRWKSEYLKRDVNIKPKTKPVVIGDDIWIGRNVSILKGCVLGDCSICGMGIVLSNKEVAANTTIVPTYSYKIIKNNI